jgi:DNA-directed RNA polymerase subunit RPC12/RpoP
MEFEDFDIEEPPRMVRVKCKYCGRYFELAEEVQLNPETGEYEYICPNCAKKFGKNQT